MTLVQTIGFTSTLFTNNGYFEQSGKWSNVNEFYTALDISSPFQGYSLNWGDFDTTSTLNAIEDTPYSGYNTNWGGLVTPGHVGDAVVNAIYAGYTTNWGSYDEPIDVSIVDKDKDTIIDHPKDQIIYYKLKGWNPMTSSYESWVVSHNITGHPSLDGALFDPIPGYAPPNVERDVFKTPPSGNTLTNIIVVARWFE